MILQRLVEKGILKTPKSIRQGTIYNNPHLSHEGCDLARQGKYSGREQVSWTGDDVLEMVRIGETTPRTDDSPRKLRRLGCCYIGW